MNIIYGGHNLKSLTGFSTISDNVEHCRDTTRCH